MDRAGDRSTASRDIRTRQTVTVSREMCRSVTSAGMGAGNTVAVMNARPLLTLPLLALLLSGCTINVQAGPDPAPDAPAPTATAEPDEPTAAPGPDSPMTARDVYDECVELALTYYQGDPALIEFTPFEEAQVVTRDDGYIYTYIEVIDRNQEEYMMDRTASECIMGGTIGDPDRVLYGVTTRHDDRDPNAPLPSA